MKPSGDLGPVTISQPYPPYRVVVKKGDESYLYCLGVPWRGRADKSVTNKKQSILFGKKYILKGLPVLILS